MARATPISRTSAIYFNISFNPTITSLLTSVTVSPSPQSQIETEEKLHVLQKYACDFRRQHMKDVQDFNWDSDDEDHGLAIGRLVVT
jgi:hypothetical protein